jgi:hypothetical protein
MAATNLSRALPGQAPSCRWLPSSDAAPGARKAPLDHAWGASSATVQARPWVTIRWMRLRRCHRLVTVARDRFCRLLTVRGRQRHTWARYGATPPATPGGERRARPAPRGPRGTPRHRAARRGTGRVRQTGTVWQTTAHNGTAWHGTVSVRPPRAGRTDTDHGTLGHRLAKNGSPPTSPRRPPMSLRHHETEFPGPACPNRSLGTRRKRVTYYGSQRALVYGLARRPGAGAGCTSTRGTCSPGGPSARLTQRLIPFELREATPSTRTTGPREASSGAQPPGAHASPPNRAATGLVIPLAKAGAVRSWHQTAKIGTERHDAPGPAGTERHETAPVKTPKASR